MERYTTVRAGPPQHPRPGFLELRLTALPPRSNPHPALLLLHIHNLHHPPPRHNLHNPTRNPLRPRLGILPPPRPRNLPNPALRAADRRAPHPRPRRLGHRHPPAPPRPEPPTLRRRHAGRPPTPRPQTTLHTLPPEDMAPAVLDILLRLRPGAGRRPPRLCQPRRSAGGGG